MSSDIFEVLTWKQARPLVKGSCDDELVQIIDRISPDDRYKLIRVRFPFGDKIVENGLLNFPVDKTKLLPLTDLKLSDFVKKNLTYLPVPLGIITKNHVEVYRENADKVFSLAINPHGFEFGIWEFCGSTTPYSIVSGARSLYMIPRISVAALHKKLRNKYGISSAVPQRLMNHWDVFKDLSRSSSFGESWCSEILFLTKDWFDRLKDKNISPDWLYLKSHIQQKGWEHSTIGRKRLVLDVLWQAIVHDLNCEGLKINPYVVDTFKHMIFVMLGMLPASAPFSGDEHLGPLNKLQEAYVDDYGLADYIPTIMMPSYFSMKEKLPVYYSLQNPTLLELSPRTKQITSNMDDLRELKFFTEHLVKESVNTDLNIDGCLLSELLQKISFHFFHGDQFAYGGIIKPTSKLPEQDLRFSYTKIPLNKAQFASNGAFIRGCVRLSLKSS